MPTTPTRRVTYSTSAERTGAIATAAADGLELVADHRNLDGTDQLWFAPAPEPSTSERLEALTSTLVANGAITQADADDIRRRPRPSRR